MKNEIESSFPRGVSYVNHLLSRHEIPERERSKLVQRALNLSYHSALRRMNGIIPWTIEELDLLAAHFEESVTDVVIAARPQNSQPATLLIEETKLSCMVCIEKELDHDGISPSFVAVKEKGNGWSIYQSSNAPTNKTLFSIKSIELNLHQTGNKPVIAVVDDDEVAAQTLSMYLNQQDLIAIPYYTLHDFRMAQKNTVFSAYVLDWRMGKCTVEEDIRNIRQLEEETKAPIIILTGTLSAGNSNAADIAHVVREYDTVLLQKPAYLQILHAELSKMLDKVRNISGATSLNHAIELNNQ